jgi:hypothetical protein
MEVLPLCLEAPRQKETQWPESASELYRPSDHRLLAKLVPLWSGGQSSWLQIQTTGLDSLRYQIFWEAVGLERGST